VSVAVKICGLRDAPSVAAAVEGGAKYVGFVFYAKSPRAVASDLVAALIVPLPKSVVTVGLFVDPSDEDVMRVLRVAPLQMIQLHGAETSQRVAAIKTLTGLPVMKAVGVASVRDITPALAFEDVADMLLLDAKPVAGQLPGGNATAFDWNILKGAVFSKPWMLAGGLNADNIDAATAATGARIVDVSSGIEDAPGRKNTGKIKAFLEKAAQIETCS
jgi:phosphoribosylanthranilate isomerase